MEQLGNGDGSDHDSGSPTEENDDEHSPEFQSINRSEEAPTLVLNGSSNDGLNEESQWVGKLYDRSHQFEMLKECYLRCIIPTKSSTASLEEDDEGIHESEQETSAPRRRELVLITGASGTGKTALAKSLVPMVVQHRGYFIGGKFDLLKKVEGFPAFVAAFTDFCRQVVDRGDTERLQKQIESRLSEEDVKILVDTVPAIAQLMSSQDIVTSGQPTAKGSNAQIRFQQAFQRFVRVISSRESPIVLFLDDLQWADVGSLELLAALVKASRGLLDPGTKNDTKSNNVDSSGLLILGACRGNEVSINDALSVTLRQLENEHNVLITDIAVSNLSEKAVNDLISDELNVPQSQCRSLTNMVFQQTDGNIFFLTQLLQSLKDEGYLYQNNNKGKYKWEADVISALRKEDVMTMISEKMKRLDDSAQQLLEYAACLGAEFDEYLLHEIDVKDVVKSLETIVKAGYVVEIGGGSCRWVHDRIQQAAYLLIPEDEKAQFHLDIGRHLWHNLQSSELQLQIFLVINQLCRGKHLIVDEEERHEVAILCLSAGQKATMASAFQVATSFFEDGISLLGRRHWRDEYELSLELFNSAAEVAYTCGDFDQVDEKVDEVVQHARRFRDTLRAMTTKVYSLGARNQLIEGMKLGFEVLEQLGEKFPKTVRFYHLIFAIMQSNRLLKGKTNEDLMALPYMSDPNKIAALRMIMIVMPYTFFTKGSMAAILCARGLALTMEHGLTGMAGFFFSFHGISLCVMGKPREARRYALLSMEVQEKLKALEWEARNISQSYGMIMGFTEPSREFVDILRRGHRSGMSSGDIEFACLCSSHVISLSFHSGEPMLQHIDEFHSYLQLMNTYRQEGSRSFFTPYLQLILNLTGERGSANPLVLTGSTQDEEEVFRVASQRKLNEIESIMFHLKAIISIYMREYEAGSKYIKAFRKVSQTPVNPPLSIFSQLFTEAVSALTANVKFYRVARRNLKKLKEYEVMCPPNVRNKTLLVEALLAAATASSSPKSAHAERQKALRLFNESIDYAGTQLLLHEQALACEFAGDFVSGQFGDEVKGLEFYERAAKLYKEWGATVKVVQLKDLFGVEA